jgi:hypothetical protein
MAIYPCTAAFKRILCVRHGQYRDCSRSKLQRSIERPSGFYEVCAILISELDDWLLRNSYVPSARNIKQ